MYFRQLDALKCFAAFSGIFRHAVFYFSAVDVAEVAGFGAYFVTRYPPHAANIIPKIKIPDTLLQALVLVVLTMAFTIGAPAKIIDIITGTYATVGFGAAPKASNTPSAQLLQAFLL